MYVDYEYNIIEEIIGIIFRLFKVCCDIPNLQLYYVNCYYKRSLTTRAINLHQKNVIW